MNGKSRAKAREENLGDTKRKAFNVENGFPVVNKCLLCGKTDHVATVTKNGTSLIHYFACPEFAKIRRNESLKLKNNNLGFQYLNPGFKRGHNGHYYNSLIAHTQTIRNLILGIKSWFVMRIKMM